MKTLFTCMLMVLVSSAGGSERFACNMLALTKTERAAYSELAKTLLDAVQERKELRNGYAFMLPASSLVPAAQWIEFERRCCPFFAFELELSKADGPLWLRVTGREGVKAFIRSEFGFESP